MPSYAGIGSRDTPVDIQSRMRAIASALAKLGWVLHSGGAGGADLAFEQGCDEKQGKKKIYLPWKRFNGSTSNLYPPETKAFEIAAKFHPKWKYLDASSRNFMARNSYQVLGDNLDETTKVNLVICWTPNGKMVGGTSQAMRIAKAYDIPIINLANSNDKDDQETIKQILLLALDKEAK